MTAQGRKEKVSSRKRDMVVWYDGTSGIVRYHYHSIAATAHKEADSKEPMVDSALELSQVRPIASVFGDLVEDNTQCRLPLAVSPCFKVGERVMRTTIPHSCD